MNGERGHSIGNRNMIHKFHDIWKPKNFMRLSQKLWGFFMMMGLLLMMSSLQLAIQMPDTDFQQGENFKMIYIHVASAWMTLALYGIMTCFSLIYLLNQHVFFYLISRSHAVMGINFSIITLVTGSLWGRPTWGDYWVWDARLTSVLILFFLYLGYFIMEKTHEIRKKSMRNSSILAIIGFINIPIIKYSVNWWNTLHQSGSITQNYITMDLSIYIVLLLCFMGMVCCSITIFILEMRKHMILRKMETYYL
jgi:heme exporter protein C